MKKPYQSIAAFIVGALMSAGVTAPIFASDIETIVGQVKGNSGANVMLIMDTSGSMESEVLINGHEYEEAVNYSGPFDEFELDGANPRIFYVLTQGNDIDFLDETNIDSLNYVLPQYYLCAAGQTVMSNTGYYTDRHAQFGSEGRWNFLIAAGNDIDGPIGEVRRTECRADEGIHGNTASDNGYPIILDPVPDNPTLVYPWSPDPNHPDRIDWNDTGSRYTFFSNNFLNWIYERKTNPNLDPVLRTRLQIVQDVSINLTADLKELYLSKAGTLNLGVMRFSDSGSGGMVLSGASDITTNQGDLVNVIDELLPFGNTPLAETMFEAMRYFSGDTAYFGLDTTPVPSNPNVFREDGVTYISPIEAACQKNYIVLLTDGQPVGDFQANAEIEALTGTCAGSCLNELTEYLYTTDLATGTGLEGVQSVDTFVIGFFTDSTLLQDSATGQVLYSDDNQLLNPPQDGYFLADDPDQLADAFRSIFNQVNSNVNSFTAPAVSVNSLNRLTNRDTLYFTMFEPSTQGQPHWNGNLKAYKIGRVGGVGDITILDSSDQAAVDANGAFLTGAQSVWSAEPDGGVVSDGGMASRLSASRKIFSNLTGNTNVSLSTAANRIAEDNAAAISPLVNVPEGDELDALIAFAQGLDGDGAAAQILGDPLHSEPLMINYGGGPDDLMLIFGTNDGYLHAVNVEPGSDTEDLERFAFIPKELLIQLPILKANQPSEFAEANKAYGMDGPITAWLKETDGDFIVEDNEQLMVYAAMRRGGSSYYALDMSDRATPKLVFTINPSIPGFEDLGQTWSAATYGKVKYDGGERDVLFFGGGYDTNQDSANTGDTKGNAVYMVDAVSGALLWRAGGTDSNANLELADMNYSIPSEIRIIDIDQDGDIDRLYVGDMGAQVWRFDIDSTATTFASAISGGLLAQLGGATVANERRFYSPPSVSRFIEDSQVFLTVSIGSGYRAGPLSTLNEDRFYVLRDNNVYAPALDNGVPVYGDTNVQYLTTEADLLTLSIAANADGVVANPGDGIPAGQFGKGWMMHLNAEPGEKSLTPAITADGRVFFTTYSPGSPTQSCDASASVGTGRLYGIDILTGLPDLYGDVDGSPAVLYTTLGPTGIPPAPKLVFTTPDCTDCDENIFSESSLLTGAQVDDINLSTDPVRTYWFQTGIADGD